MQNEEKDLRDRTKQFALRILEMFSVIPKSTQAQVLGKQVLRSGTSVGANYREAYRGRSKAEFVAKCGDSLRDFSRRLSAGLFFGARLIARVRSRSASSIRNFSAMGRDASCLRKSRLLWSIPSRSSFIFALGIVARIAPNRYSNHDAETFSDGYEEVPRRAGHRPVRFMRLTPEKQRLVSSGNLVRGGTGWVRLHEVSLGDRCITRAESLGS
jgi:hypothetical protein